MTAAVLTQLPLAAGSALASGAVRAARWGIQQYGRAPLANTAIAGLVTFSLLAMGNALYFQRNHHPAPMFAPFDRVTEAAPVPVVPAVRSPKLKVPAVRVPVVASPAETSSIGNRDVFEVQRKLQAFGLFDGTLDGYYGPKTARAIKRFEERQGLKPLGELTPEIIAAIMAAPLMQEAPAPVVVAPAPVVEQQMTLPETIAPAPATNVQPNAVLGEIAVPGSDTLVGVVEPLPLPTPAPLEAEIQTGSVQPRAVTRPLPQSADEALGIASDVAGDALDALVAAVNGKVQLGPISQPLPERVEVAPEVAVAPSPEAELVPPGSVEDIVTASMAPVATTPVDAGSVNDPKLVARVQRGLASLGFLRTTADGVPGEATAKAIRNFEVWNNYEVTGRITPELLNLLIAAGADV